MRLLTISLVVLVGCARARFGVAYGGKAHSHLFAADFGARVPIESQRSSFARVDLAGGVRLVGPGFSGTMVGVSAGGSYVRHPLQPTSLTMAAEATFYVGGDAETTSDVFVGIGQQSSEGGAVTIGPFAGWVSHGSFGLIGLALRLTLHPPPSERDVHNDRCMLILPC